MRRNQRECLNNINFIKLCLEKLTNNIKALTLSFIAATLALGTPSMVHADMRSKITDYLLGAVGKLKTEADVKDKLCRKGDAKKGRFSLRSGQGILCKDVHGAFMATVVCAPFGNIYPGFKKSDCYKNAKKVMKENGSDITSSLKNLTAPLAVLGHDTSKVVKLMCAVAEKVPSLKEKLKDTCKKVKSS